MFLKRTQRRVLFVFFLVVPLGLFVHVYRCQRQKDFARTFQKVINTLNNIQADYIIADGTVLSWFRDHNAGQSDIDIAIDFGWWRQSLAGGGNILHAALENAGCSPHAVFGQNDTLGYEEAWICGQVKVDFMAQATRGHTHIFGLTIDGNTYECQSVYTHTSMQSMFDVTFPVPEPTEKYLTEKYGNWKLPDENYEWSVSPFKTGQCFKDRVLYTKRRF